MEISIIILKMIYYLISNKRTSIKKFTISSFKSTSNFWNKKILRVFYSDKYFKRSILVNLLS